MKRLATTSFDEANFRLRVNSFDCTNRTARSTREFMIVICPSCWVRRRFFVFGTKIPFLSCIHSDSSGPPPDSYMTYYWKHPGPLGSADRNSHESITLLESRTTIESGTTGLRTWRASFVLGNYLIANAGMIAMILLTPAFISIYVKGIVRDQTVLELGCGTGFLGIVVATLQQKYKKFHQSHSQALPAVLMTDINAGVLSRCHDNVRLRCSE
jgi:protein-lysine N-methyltransferase EEF2KMT